MSGGVTAYAVLCSIFLLVYCAWMLRKYAHSEDTPLHVYASVLLSWLFSLILVYLLPLDLIPRFENHQVLLPFYETIYWISFTSMWIIIPLQQGYVLSGYFTFKGKILDSIMQNIYFFLAVGALFVVGLVYIAFTVHMQASKIASLAIALSNVYGLSLGILTLGYGLVEIPRNLWYASNVRKRLVYLNFLACQVGNDRDEARDRLDEILFLFYSARERGDNASRYMSEFQVMEDEIPAAERARAADIMNGRVTRPVSENEALREAILENEPDGVTPKVCATLQYELKGWLFEVERSNKQFHNVMIEIFTLEGILQEKRKHLLSQLSPRSSLREKLGFYFEVYVRPVITKVGAVVLGFCSALIVWSELALTFKSKKNLSPFAMLVDHARSSTTGADTIIIFGLFLFSYMTVCALYALFRLRLMKYYHMHSYKCTDANSLLFNAAYTQRLMFSLGYNFLLICLGDQHVRNSPFVSLVGRMDSIPLLGAPVNTFLPILVVIFVGATFFNVYGWLLKCLRISRFEFSSPNRSEEVRSQIREGELLVRKFKRELESDPALVRELGIADNQFASRSLSIMEDKRRSNGHVPIQLDDLNRGDSPPGSVGYDMRNISIDT